MEIFFLILFVFLIVKAAQSVAMSPEQKRERKNLELWGKGNSAMICPHCQTRGRIRTKAVTLKKGLSGAKATGAFLTGGLSMLATGLSRKENCTQAHCTRCNSTWFF